MTHSLVLTTNQALLSHYNHHTPINYFKSQKSITLSRNRHGIQQHIFCRGSVQDWIWFIPI